MDEPENTNDNNIIAEEILYTEDVDKVDSSLEEDSSIEDPSTFSTPFITDTTVQSLHWATQVNYYNTFYYLYFT